MNVNYGLGADCSTKKTVDHLTNNLLKLLDTCSTTIKKTTVKFLLDIFPHRIIDEKDSIKKIIFLT